jgi:hypothetical protein
MRGLEVTTGVSNAHVFYYYLALYSFNPQQGFPVSLVELVSGKFNEDIF